ncbi:hypothetical protein CTheo_2260 [Ceratobasidium theobromae]|uniref:Myb-like domain-containing protein n=1 Tax=Ceratobasidium theobromae TaxID=1582974 RepID=A0A5N5QRF7_9AGAM|nr:hypothetical protein CTheo_2260 [Ceratobasidium theobromae]
MGEEASTACLHGSASSPRLLFLPTTTMTPPAHYPRARIPMRGWTCITYTLMSCEESAAPAPPRSRAFFDVVLGTSPPSPALAAQLAPVPMPRSPTPDCDTDESDRESDPEPSRQRVLVMLKSETHWEPAIPTSDVRGTSPDTSCEETRRQFDMEYSTHKNPMPKRALRSKPKPEPLRKSSRLATRPTTPQDDPSTTDTRSLARRPKRRPEPKSRPEPRSTSSPAPQPTSIAYPPDDPPPPAPTHIVSLRPGYNAYTPEDKQWFLDFVAWVFRQNVHAGKAEICQDIFHQAPHHRLESWKSYWRDHISQVEALRNMARGGLDKPAQPARGTARINYSPRPSSSGTETDSDIISTPKMTHAPVGEANKSSLWKLAELAEIELNVATGAPNRQSRPGSFKRRALDIDSEVAHTKRPRY